MHPPVSSSSGALPWSFAVSTVFWLVGSISGVRHASGEIQTLRNPLSVKRRFSDTTLVSYSYFEKDDMQRDNLEFFMRHGSLQPSFGNFFTVYIVSGKQCSPCQQIVAKFGLEDSNTATKLYLGDITAAYTSQRVALLRRKENLGMDFGNHNISLSWLMYRAPLVFKRIKYFVFLNSSVRGPFLPSYFSMNSPWTSAFTSLLNSRVKVVSPSLVCFPKNHRAAVGPRLESFVFATDKVGLRVMSIGRVFDIRIRKGDIVLHSEYGMTKAAFAAGYNVATLLYKYGVGIDWRDEKNWNCNDNVHPSRECSYDGISQTPFETVFVKSSWGVSSKLVSKYSKWADAKLVGNATQGIPDILRHRNTVRSTRNGISVCDDPVLE